MLGKRVNTASEKHCNSHPSDMQQHGGAFKSLDYSGIIYEEFYNDRFKKSFFRIYCVSS